MHLSVYMMKRTLLFVLTLSGQRHFYVLSVRLTHISTGLVWLMHHLMKTKANAWFVCYCVKLCWFFFPSGLSALSVNTVREYHFVHILKTWAEAQHYCREMFTDLATVENPAEDTRLSALQGGRKNAWIGLYDDLTRWWWSLRDEDFSNNTDFSNWHVGEPVTKDYKQYKRGCTVMDPNVLWHSSLCIRLRPVVCFYGKTNLNYR